MTIVNISEAKKQLSDLIQKAINGEKVVIADNNTPIFELHKLETSNQDRVPNLYKGQVKVIGKWEEGDKLVEKLMYNSSLDIDGDNSH